MSSKDVTSIVVRAARPSDADAIDEIHLRAFGQPDEGKLVRALTATAKPIVSLVAEQERDLIGHVLFTPVNLEPDCSLDPRTPTVKMLSAMALGPMGVIPEFQRKGVGAALIEEGFQVCRRLGRLVVFVLGHADYYPRFGFVPTVEHGISCEFSVADENFMLLELEPGALRGRTGTVRYHPEFHKL